MDLNYVKKELKSSKYNFLREEKELKDNIELLVLAGSMSYGTDEYTKEHFSDIDLRGVKMISIDEVLSMNYNESPYINNNTDTTIYSFKQFINFLIDNNPYGLEIIGVKNDCILHSSDKINLLRNNIDLILSERVYDKYIGYANQQLKRLKNAVARNDNYSYNQEQNLKEAVEGKMKYLKELYPQLNNNSYKIYMDKDTKDFFVDINNINHCPFEIIKDVNESLGQVLKKFKNTRKKDIAPPKDEFHLYKHAMHSVRGLLVGKEILEGKGINVYREDYLFLLDILHKKYTLEELFVIIEDLKKDLLYAKNNTSLPKTPNIEAIKEIALEINKAHIKKLFS